MTDKILILTTCPTEDEGERLARVLVEARLAACVNVLAGARSFYRWKGAIESSRECLLVIKSSRELFAEVCTLLEQAHSYEVPEAVAFTIVDGAENYMNWLDANLRGREGAA